MFPKIFTILFAVATAVVAVPFGPAPALVESLIPYSPATVNITGELGVAATNPTITFWPTANCVSGGIRNTLIDRVFQQCYSPLPNPFTSVAIDNPDGTYIPYTVWVSFTAPPAMGGSVETTPEARFDDLRGVETVGDPGFRLTEFYNIKEMNLTNYVFGYIVGRPHTKVLRVLRLRQTTRDGPLQDRVPRSYGFASPRVLISSSDKLESRASGQSRELNTLTTFPKILAIFFAVATAAFAVLFGPSNALVELVVLFSRTAAVLNGTSEFGVAATNPTILFCSTANCTSNCFRYSLIDRVYQTCYLPISNPVWVSFTGASCPTGLVEMPATNTRYNLTPTG
ncbi:hypothetical protein Hypma_003899 [Hypsizygus marmoreus]|uniref:Apple domain-containing protein n=1 Tax=Hypsizygus marmoreus TaxID=39966 RepID=A0A369K9B6_HYPMA|nr:hypothetical protein Hypma_003899 [Hypsizygus marmoreus]